MKSLRCPKWKRVQTRLCQYILLPPQDSFCEHTHTHNVLTKRVRGNRSLDFLLMWQYYVICVKLLSVTSAAFAKWCGETFVWIFQIHATDHLFPPARLKRSSLMLLKKKIEHVGRFPFNGSGWIFPTCCPRLQHKGLSIFVQVISRHSLLRRCECMLLWTSSK